MVRSGCVQRIEFWAIADNPVCKLYRRFAKQFGGKQVAYLHRTEYYEGKYHDSICWEFLMEDMLPIIQERDRKPRAKTGKHTYDFGDLSEYEEIG